MAQVVYNVTRTFENLNRAGKTVNLTAFLGTGTIVIRRELLGDIVDVIVPNSGIYELAVNDEPVTIVVTGNAKYALE